MRILTLLVVSAVCSLGTHAQPGTAIPENIRAANIIENLFDINGLSKFDNFYGIPLPPGKVVGNAYLHDDWKRSTFLLYDQDRMIEGYPARYAIDRDEFEIRTSSGIKVLKGTMVRSFVSVDSLSTTPRYYANGRSLRDSDGQPLSGFFEVLEEGTHTLLAKTDVVVKDPTYKEQFDMGHRDTRILKKTSYFYLFEGVVRELPPAKKKLIAVFGARGEGIEDFIRVNRLSLDDAAHLSALFAHANAIAKE